MIRRVQTANTSRYRIQQYDLGDFLTLTVIWDFDLVFRCIFISHWYCSFFAPHKYLRLHHISFSINQWNIHRLWLFMAATVRHSYRLKTETFIQADREREREKLIKSNKQHWTHFIPMLESIKCMWRTNISQIESNSISDEIDFFVILVWCVPYYFSSEYTYRYWFRIEFKKHTTMIQRTKYWMDMLTFVYVLDPEHRCYRIQQQQQIP